MRKFWVTWDVLAAGVMFRDAIDAHSWIASAIFIVIGLLAVLGAVLWACFPPGRYS